MDTTTSEAVARAVAEHLLRMDRNSLARYLSELYGIEHPGPLSTTEVYVVEVSAGDIRQAAISSDPVRWWKVGPAQTVSIPYLDMTPFNEVCDAGSHLWPYPVVSFYASLPEGLTCEGVGPATKCYRRIRLHPSASGLGVAHCEIARKING